MSHPAAPRFSELCKLLHALDARRGEKPPTKASREAMLRAFFERHVPVGTAERTVCAIMALLLPAEDDRRYWLKESRLAGAIASALGIAGSSAGQRLVDWQDAEVDVDSGRPAPGAGDLSLLVGDAMRERVGGRAALEPGRRVVTCCMPVRNG